MNRWDYLKELYKALDCKITATNLPKDREIKMNKWINSKDEND